MVIVKGWSIPVPFLKSKGRMREISSVECQRKRAVVSMRKESGLKKQRVQQTVSPRWKAWAVSVALSVPMLTAAAWAQNFPLSNIDFLTHDGKTAIILHTGSIVPVNHVHADANKLILDISQVDAAPTVHTNFSGAHNISHVIMQPMGKNSVRMIVRGERLGVPSIAFAGGPGGASVSASASAEAARHQRLAEETALSLHQIQEDNIRPAVLEENGMMPPLPDESGIQSTSMTTATEAIDSANAADLAIDTTTTPPSTSTESIEPLPTPTALETDELAPVSLTPEADPAASQSALDRLADRFANDNTVTSYLPYGLLALLLIGAAGFIWNKLRRLGQQETSLEDLLEAQAQGKRVGFREMATAYRNKHEKGSDVFEKPGERKAKASDMIGLGALKAPTMPAPTPSVGRKPKATPPAQPAAPLDDLMATLLQKSQPTATPTASRPAPKKQALHQYQQNAGAIRPAKKPATTMPRPKASAQPPLPSMTSGQPALSPGREIKQAEWQREEITQAIKRAPKAAAPANRAPAAARKQGLASSPLAAKRNSAAAPGVKPNGPLPGNPEVLNFLRNVAELMEKDGKPEIARNIHRNLNERQLGV